MGCPSNGTERNDIRSHVFLSVCGCPLDFIGVVGERSLGYFCGSFIPSIVRRICYLRDANLFSRSTSTIYSTWSIILLDRLRKCDKTWSRRLNHQMSITNQVAGHRCSYHHELSQRCQKTSWESVFYADWNWLQSSVAFSGQENFEETDL